eukprot:TRINITY_DN7127_c1_g1_i1.p1 TRINITY_DN7127_c1_g1~~TRINITY_DN7127_c1_g1_i1.p1  ORF type:complete len:121 (+),score=28.12 TRINITY_DN7127_c1_g1_i1:61-423(+)
MGNCQSPPARRVTSASTLKRASNSMSSMNSCSPIKETKEVPAPVCVCDNDEKWGRFVVVNDDEEVQTQDEGSSISCETITHNTSIAMALNIKMDNRTLGHGEFLWTSGRSLITSYSAEEE